jgi:hypothetical protein
MRSPFPALVVFLLLVACSGDEERPVKQVATEAARLTAPQTRWRFVDAFAALRSSDPGQRLSAVEWIARNLSTHRALAIEALRAALADDAPEVAARARQLLSAFGERGP